MWWYIMLYYIILRYIRRKFRSQTCDNMDRWKSKDGKSQRREEKKREDQRRERVRRKKMQMRARNGIKVAIRCVFPMMCGFGVSKSRLAKAAGAESSGQMGDEQLQAVVTRSTFPSQNVQSTRCSEHFWKLRWWKKCMPLWREGHFQVKMHKTRNSQTTLGNWDVERVHAIVARSTFRSQNVQSTPFSDHFWKLRYRKSARSCGAKHTSKSKCTKHLSLGALLEVEMSKKVNAVLARSTFPSQNVQNITCSRHFWRFRCAFAWQAQGIVHLLKSEKNVRGL